MAAVAKGYPTARIRLATRPQTRPVVTPAIDEIYAMLYEGKDIRQAVRDLMARELKAED